MSLNRITVPNGPNPNPNQILPYLHSPTKDVKIKGTGEEYYYYCKSITD